MTTRTKVDFHSVRQGRKEIVAGMPRKPESPSRVPRVARLLALAIRFKDSVQSGEVADYAELARLGRITKARMSQIMGLLQLAPDIQEEILFLSAAAEGRDPVTERKLRTVVAEADWVRQRKVRRKMPNGLRRSI